MLSLLRQTHRWAGFMLALIIMLISLTGVMLVWKKQYLWLTEPATRTEFSITPASAARIALAAENRFDKKNIRMISFGIENLSVHKIWLGNYKYAYLDNHGNLIDQWHLNERFEEMIYDLHHRLLLGDTGLLIAGLSALVILGLLPAALLVWWPYRQTFNWRIWKRGLTRPYLLASHRNLGVVSALPVALVLLSGIILTFPDESKAILVEPYNKTDSYSALYKKNLDNITGEGKTGYLAAFHRAQASFPNAKIRSVIPPNSTSNHYKIQLQKQGDWHQSGLNMVSIDAITGNMDLRLDASELPRGERLYNVSYPLHTGKTDSVLYKISVTLFGTCLFTLALLGFYSFGRKLLNV